MKAKKWHEKLTEEQREIIAKYLKILSERGKQIDTAVREISPEMIQYVKNTRIEAKDYFLNRYFPEWADENCPDGWPDENDIVRAINDYLNERSSVLRDPEPEPEEKPYNSIDWTVTFTLAIAYIRGKIDRDTWENSKQRLEHAKRLKAKIIGADPQTVNGKRPHVLTYDIYPVGTIEPKEIRLTDQIRLDEKREKDYEYALKLYEKYF